MPHPALQHTEHRPWPLPPRPWAMTMGWEDLAFLHWPIAASTVQEHLPAGVTVETFAGTAWLGVVPFRMVRTRWRCLPPVPGTSAFPELNVRTYVRCGGRSGVWFFSLDAQSRLAVGGARVTFGLPYFHARMRCERDGSSVVYASERRDRRGPPAAFAASWRANGAPVPVRPGSLEHFLVERYCLFALRRGRLWRGDIAHAPWRLAPAEARIERCEMTALLGVPLAAPPASVLVAEPQTVVAWWPVRA